MPNCLFCSNAVVKKVCENPVQEAILSFFGYQIQDYLFDEDVICDICLNGIEILAHIKKVLLPYIYREDPCIEQKKPVIIGTQWEYIATLNFRDIPWNPAQNIPNGLNGLVACKRVEPYMLQQEKLFEYLEHDRSLSRNSNSRSDSEVELIFKKKRKRKRNRWTHRKKSVYSETDSPASSIRTISRQSRASTVSNNESNRSFSCNNLKYVNGCLVNKRTRSVSRQQEEEAKLIFNNTQLYQCREPDCDFLCESVDAISEHKRKIHKMMTLFLCNECGNKYTTRDELMTHQSEHIDKFSCTICQNEFRTEHEYREHWQVHVRNSTICRYCKLRYLKTVIMKHQKDCRIVRKTKITLNNDNDLIKEKDRRTEFQVKILIQNENENC